MCIVLALDGKLPGTTNMIYRNQKIHIPFHSSGSDASSQLAVDLVVVPEVPVLHHVLPDLGGVNPGHKVLQGPGEDIIRQTS